MSYRRPWRIVGLAVVAGLLLPACGAGIGAPGSRTAGISTEGGRRDRGRRDRPDEERGEITQAELSQLLERISTDFISKVNEAGGSLLDSLEGRTRTRAAKQMLIYESSVLEIATG